MGTMLQLTTQDGHELGAYQASPAGTPRGAVVVVQEIFGVNKSIRAVADAFAAEGYLAVAPALFDRFKRDIELTYTGVDKVEAFALMQLLSPDKALLDVAAAAAEASKTVDRVAVMGFCFGGLMSWLAATPKAGALGLAPTCCVGYYPGGVGKAADQPLSCPVILHIGADDSHIGQDQIDAVKSAHPDVPVYLYAASGHGFANPDREEYNEAQAKVAWGRTLSFVGEHLKG